MKEVIKSCKNCQDHQAYRNPVSCFLSSSQTIGLDVFLVSGRKHEGCPAGGIRGLAGSDDFFAVQISGREISFMGSSGCKDTWRRRSPRCELGVSSLNGEGISSQKTDDLGPRYSYRNEWVVDFDSAFAENNFGHNRKNPNHGSNGKPIAESNHSLGNVAGLEERKAGPKGDCDSDGQINPTRFTLENVYVLHSFEITGILDYKKASSAFPVRKVAA